MPIKRLLQRPVFTLPPRASCVEAARMMDAEEIGAVVVAEQGRPLGIVTDRDLAVRVTARGLDPRRVPLGEVMSGSPIYLSQQRGLDEVIAVMREMAVRRIMVVDEAAQLTGLLSLDDLMVLLATQLEALADIARVAVEGRARR